MKERPIILNGEMVGAVLDGRKTQTRRPVKEADSAMLDFLGGEAGDDCAAEVSIIYVENIDRIDDNGKTYKYTGLLGCTSEYPEEGYIELTSPCGVPGDRLWVRETWREWHQEADSECGCSGDPYCTCSPHPKASACYRADGHFVEPEDRQMYDIKWKPSIHMPRWSSRILLEITDIRVERVQDISEDDAIAEGSGVPLDKRYVVQEYFKPLWQSIYGEDAWNRNDWVWVIDFKPVEIKQ